MSISLLKSKDNFMSIFAKKPTEFNSLAATPGVHSLQSSGSPNWNMAKITAAVYSNMWLTVAIFGVVLAFVFRKKLPFMGFLGRKRGLSTRRR